jgi:hypothetical protein
MASIRWKIANTPFQGAILTRSNGNEIELIQEIIDPMNDAVIREGGCISIPGEAHPVKIAGFRHGGGNPPTGIFYKRWNPPVGAVPGSWISQPDDALFEVPPADYDNIDTSDCPPDSQRAGRRSRSRSRSSRKLRKSRRRLSKSRRTRRR